MRITPIALTNFRGEAVRHKTTDINIPKVPTEKLYNNNEYNELTQYTKTYLKIGPTGRGVFFNPRVDRYKIDVIKDLDNGKKIEESSIVEVDKNAKTSDLEYSIRKGVYNTYNQMLQSIIRQNLENSEN